MKRLVIIMLISLVFISGCTFPYEPSSGSSPLDIALQDSRFNEFFSTHVDLDTAIDYYPRSEVESAIAQMHAVCANLDSEADEIYKVTLTDKSTQEQISAWINWGQKQVECVG